MPRSTLYPALALDMLNGLKLSLKDQQVSPGTELVIENIGFGTNEPEIYAKAEKMLLEQDVDVVIAFADTIIAELLQPLFTATNKILLIVNFGANFPRSWKPAPTSITLSLNFCLHAKLTGKLAAQKEQKQVANVVSYYDGGYNQCYSMLNSNLLNGGIASFNHVTHLKLEEFSLRPLENFLDENTEVDTALCLFAGDQAERFYTDIQAQQQKRALDLFVSPMMLDESLFANTGIMVQRVQGYVPWHSGLQHDANDRFKETLLSNTNRPANYFSLLGWDTGLLLAEICRQAPTATGAGNIIAAIISKKYESPRGWLVTDAATHHCYGPSWHVHAAGKTITADQEETDVASAWREFTSEPLLPESSMWRNTYLCI